MAKDRDKRKISSLMNIVKQDAGLEEDASNPSEQSVQRNASAGKKNKIFNEKVKAEKTRKSTIHFVVADWDALDVIASQSKTSANNGVSRTDIVSALIKYFLKKSPDIKGTSTVEELVEILLKK